MYTFTQPLTRALDTAAGSCAVVCQGNRRTYAELGARCRRLAGAMRKLGLAPQNRVGVVALNSDRYLELYLGLPAAGYVLVPVNSRLAPAEMRAILDDAGVSWPRVQAGFVGSLEVYNPDAIVGRLGLTGVPLRGVFNGCATAGP